MPRDWKSVLLETMRERAKARTPQDVRYMLWVTAPDGAEVPLGDGGVFDWMPKLTANQRHVYVASGLGAQLVSILFRA